MQFKTSASEGLEVFMVFRAMQCIAGLEELRYAEKGWIRNECFRNMNVESRYLPLPLGYQDICMDFWPRTKVYECVIDFLRVLLFSLPKFFQGFLLSLSLALFLPQDPCIGTGDRHRDSIVDFYFPFLISRPRSPTSLTA